jgi:hypothetical protein
MGKIKYNPKRLGRQILAQMPRGARLLRDDAERRAFTAEVGEKPDLYTWSRQYRRWNGHQMGICPNLTYCTTRLLGWDKPAATEKAVVPVVDAAAVPVPTEREWFIPMIDHAGVGNDWIVYTPRSTLEEAEQFILKSNRPRGLARIVRVMLPCRQ